MHVLTKCIYCKIPIISPGLIFVQKAFLLGLFSGELIFGGVNYYRKEFCISKWVWLDNKNTLKQLTLTVHGLIIRRIFASGIWGTYFQGGAYYRNFTVCELFWMVVDHGHVHMVSPIYMLSQSKCTNYVSKHP